MTTNITIQPAGHHVLVRTIDIYRSPAGLLNHSANENVLLPQNLGGQPLTVYSTTTRTIEVFDLEPDDPRAIEAERAAGHYRPKEFDDQFVSDLRKGGTREDPLNQHGTIGAEGD